MGKKKIHNLEELIRKQHSEKKILSFTFTVTRKTKRKFIYTDIANFEFVQSAMFYMKNNKGIMVWIPISDIFEIESEPIYEEVRLN